MYHLSIRPGGYVGFRKYKYYFNYFLYMNTVKNVVCNADISRSFYFIKY